MRCKLKLAILANQKVRFVFVGLQRNHKRRCVLDQLFLTEQVKLHIAHRQNFLARLFEFACLWRYVVGF